MRVKLMIFLVLGISVASVCFAQYSSSGNKSSNSARETVINQNLNADTSDRVTTSMNGNTSTKSGGSISSTAASAESRNASGSN